MMNIKLFTLLVNNVIDGNVHNCFWFIQEPKPKTKKNGAILHGNDADSQIFPYVCFDMIFSSMFRYIYANGAPVQY